MRIGLYMNKYSSNTICCGMVPMNTGKLNIRNILLAEKLMGHLKKIRLVIPIWDFDWPIHCKYQHAY